MTTIMTNSLLEQLQLCSLTCSPQNKDKDPSPKKHKDCIINKTGKRILFPKGLTNKYCSEFLDNSTSCHHGDNCSFSRAIFPHGFAKEDVKSFEKYITKTEGYDFTSNHKPGKKVS